MLKNVAVNLQHQITDAKKTMLKEKLNELYDIPCSNDLIEDEEEDFDLDEPSEIDESPDLDETETQQSNDDVPEPPRKKQRLSCIIQ